MCVCVVNLTSPHSNKEENMCAMCIFSVLQKKKKEKKKETERNGKVHSH